MWEQASGCETGQIWPRQDGKVVWGSCKGEVGRYNVETGQEKHYWVYPQNRYGHDPDDIKYRFPRQTVVYVSPHDDRIVYQASHVLHRSTDDGVTWETISPDLTAHEPQFQIVPGSPITRDVTGEEVYSSIYSMIESRLEKGVIWVGANDGPVSVTRDNGKTWKRVTPPNIGPGGRVQTIEDSPHRRGTAYVSIYRYMREHDLKPYVFKTTDYGATWTSLADGKNGIPIDHPVHVVREDPARAGLLYAGTEFGAFVSFNDGKNWQPLQQNLPATPVTDIKVHRNDLVIATMGRSLWIMDDVTPLQQLAAMAGPGAPTNVQQNEPLGGVEELQARSLPPIYLFQPRDAIRYRTAPNGGANGEPEYPGAAAHLDVYFASPPAADTKLEVLDGKGQVIRTFNVGGSGGGVQGGRGGFGRGGGGATSLRGEAGMQRFNWDMRYPGVNNGPGGPMAPPGKFSARLTSGAYNATRAFELKADPRVLKDGVTQADLEEQFAFLIKVRDAIGDARRLAQRVDDAMKKAGVSPPGPATPGVRAMDEKFAHPLQKMWAQLNDLPGIYPQPMLLNQLQNVQRMVGQADQKVGKDAVDRLNDLLKDLQALQAEAQKATQN
jgi:photosystem II stability/assembly factor-like uncharacterized protein